MEKYSAIIEGINKGILEFNNFLNPGHHLQPINKDHIQDKNVSWDLKEEGWSDRPFPSSVSKGIYFIFGYNPDNSNEKAVYIGKASHGQSHIGGRLNTHLNNADRDKRLYKLRHLDGIDYELEFVTTIPLNETPFIASAAEEFLIYHLKSLGIKLLNHVGNK